MPHTVVLPIELYPPLVPSYGDKIQNIELRLYYAGVIRTLNNKYQKPMTCLLVYSIDKVYYNML